LSTALLTRGYIVEIKPSVADIPAFPSVQSQDDGISVSTSDDPAAVLQAQDDSVNIKQEAEGNTVLPVDDSTIIKITPC